MKRPASRSTTIRIGDAACGDVVRYHAFLYVVFGIRQHRTWVRRVNERYEEISEPIFLDPDLTVEVVRRGVERYQKSGGVEVDPLRGDTQ